MGELALDPRLMVLAAVLLLAAVVLLGAPD